MSFTLYYLSDMPFQDIVVPFIAAENPENPEGSFGCGATCTSHAHLPSLGLSP